MSRCICRRASPLSRSVPIDDRRAVFIRFTALKDLSAEQLVTGNVHRILARARMLGNIVVAWRRACVGELGKLTCPELLPPLNIYTCAVWNEQRKHAPLFNDASDVYTDLAIFAPACCQPAAAALDQHLGAA